MKDDFLFEGIASPMLDADSLRGGALPFIHYQEPVLIRGSAANGETIEFVTDGIPTGANVSPLLRSFGDVALDVVGQNLNLTSAREGHGTDEALHFDHSGGDLTIRVTVQALSFDGNGDGQVDLLAVVPFIDCLTGGVKRLRSLRHRRRWERYVADC